MSYLRTAKFLLAYNGEEVEVREASWADRVAFDEALVGGSMSEKVRGMCGALAPLILAPDALRDAFASALVPMELAIEVQREIFQLSKIDAPDLEEIPEGHEHVSHAEDSAENLSDAQPSASGSV